MGKRLVAALIGVAILLPVLLFGGVTGVDIVAFIVMWIGLDEYVRMALPGWREASLVLLGIPATGLYAAQIYASPEGLTASLVCGALLAMAFSVYAVRDIEHAGDVVARMALGLLYVPLLLSFVPLVRRFEDGLAWVFLLLVCTWFGDTGAYFAGKAFGRNKLLERVSPNKTIEGAVGGLLLSVVGACLVKAIGLPTVDWGHAIALGVLLDMAGVTGDLTESLLKRVHGVKDSGNIMPGHGGILDRIDSILFSAPVAWLYVQLTGIA